MGRPLGKPRFAAGENTVAARINEPLPTVGVRRVSGYKQRKPFQSSRFCICTYCSENEDARLCDSAAAYVAPQVQKG
jgi:hypothetical protein